MKCDCCGEFIRRIWIKYTWRSSDQWYGLDPLWAWNEVESHGPVSLCYACLYDETIGGDS